MTLLANAHLTSLGKVFVVPTRATTDNLFDASHLSDTLLDPPANSTPVSPSNATLALPIQHDIPASSNSDDGSVYSSFKKTLAEMDLTDAQCTFILRVLLNGVMSTTSSTGDGPESSGGNLKRELEGAEDGKEAKRGRAEL